MSIDWTKAPEGATHWEPRRDEYREAWMKNAADKWFFWGSRREAWIEESGISAEREATFEARPQEAWGGHGLPPTGLLVEWKSGLDHEWRRVTVLAYANGDAWLQPEDGDSFIVGNPENFRRIRTPEQIAAEEREKAVGDMAMSIQGVPYQYPTLYALFDAGYRRQEEGK
ncbi:hypothetical protein ACM7N2_25790 [Pseudomonas aeruginosa]|uniref:hypothetical protein n=1 Tax=Pseudomonas paraeruginosa TaxID=2994495 RepID=UPI00374A4802